MNILGQDKLLATISSYTYNTFPKSVILLGEQGCGKHLTASFVAEKFGLELLDITELISQEFINEVSARVIPTLYVIDASKITDRHQNMILKFLEEPTEYVFIMILCEDKVNLLPTIINRCVTLEFAQYSDDLLKSFITDESIDKDLAISICRTPGQLKSLAMIDMSSLRDLCTKMVSKLSVASYTNTLSISDKLNYKDEYNKFDVKLFFNMLINALFEDYKKTNNQQSLKMYLIAIEYVKKMRDKRVNRKYLVENFLSTIWQEVRK